MRFPITKNEDLAQLFRNQGNTCYKKKELEKSFQQYTYSLTVAGYGGTQYALALSNRSAVLFEMKEFEVPTFRQWFFIVICFNYNCFINNLNCYILHKEFYFDVIEVWNYFRILQKLCIEDIKLCFKANVPEKSKPKLYIRKARAFQNLGEKEKMKDCLIYLLSFLNGSSITTAEKGIDTNYILNCKQYIVQFLVKYEKSARELLSLVDETAKVIVKDKFSFKIPSDLPDFEKNENFLNAASCVSLK